MTLISTLELRDLRIPFTTAFRHASASRAETESVLVIAKSPAGLVGVGECCPRNYVTGESIESVRRFFEAHARDIIGTVNDVPALLQWALEHKQVIDASPAAWCALELAVLDLIGRLQKKSLEALLGLPELQRPHQYTAVVGDQSPASFEATLRRYQALNFRDYKIKLSGNLARDQSKCHMLEATGIRYCRADANNLWQDAKTASAYLHSLAFGFVAIEEPLQANDIASLITLADSLETLIILDESLVRIEQLDSLHAASDHFWLNLRASKLGGLSRSIALIDKARQLNLKLIVGAQVGETSILTRAGLTLSEYAGDLLLAQEGAFGSHLLQYDIADPQLQFSAAGNLSIHNHSVSASPGNGLNLSMELVRAAPIIAQQGPA
uniref:mandelate racemase/muconate lactonizing enzyme family protein n=1 Tax=Marinobacterium profundum TaxID=1714300 RepID=UPI0008372C94|nr:enolase C-terminal domain-like protein [Marinobacterium profundum]